MTATTIRRTVRKGFTLIEILIVVIILGILAAIVIPQFTNASTEAKRSSLMTTVQTLRSQVALYKLQHQDRLPPLATFWTAMTTKTDAAGAAYVAGTSTTGPFGPYMQSTAVNSLNSLSTVIDGDGTAAAGSDTGYVYDYNGGNGSGKIWGTDTDKRTLVP